MAAFILADAHAFGVVAISTKGRGPGGADPLVAALMAALLLFEAFFECFHQLVEAAQSFDLGFFLFRQMLFGHLLEPVGGDVHGLHNLLETDLVEPFKGRGKGAVELVDVALVFDHGGAGEIVERFDVVGRKTGLHAVQKAQILVQADRHAALSKCLEEGQEHRTYPMRI